MLKLEQAHKQAALAAGRLSGMIARRRISPQALALANVELGNAVTLIKELLKYGLPQTD